MGNHSYFESQVLQGATCIEVTNKDRETAITLLVEKASRLGLFHPKCNCQYYYDEEPDLIASKQQWLDGFLITYPEEIRQEVIDNMKRIEESK